MKKCSGCGKRMKEMTSRTPEGIGYAYFKCGGCGEEVLDMSQLHAVAAKYRAMKRYHAKMSRWGKSLGLRIPKELAKKYKFREEEEVLLIPDEKGIKIVPATL